MNRWRDVCVIVNPGAGEKAGISVRNDNGSPLEMVRDLLRPHGLDDAISVTESEEEAVALARDAVSRGCELVVAAGGDGTAGTLAAELLGSETALGILPFGSVMNIARMLGLPREPEEAAAVLATGVVRRIDVGRANGRLFFEAGSAGMNAAIFEEAQRFDAGEYRSVLRALWIAIRYRPPRMKVDLDDSAVETRALMVAVANGPYTGIGFTVAPDAQLDDGLLDVVIFRGFSRVRLLLHLARVAFGREHYTPRVWQRRSRDVRIDSRSPLPCRADANDLGTTPVTFTTLPGALKVVVPRE